MGTQDAGRVEAKRVEARMLEEARSSSATWAGSWRDADGTLVLAFTDRSDGTFQQLLGRVGAPAAPVRVQQVQFTLRELRTVDEQMYALATSEPGFETVHSWSVRPSRNRVVAYTESVDQARTEFARAGVDMAKVEFQEARGQFTYKPLACTRTRCEKESMRGGLAWFSSKGACTTGFGATRNGEEGFMSAGHCASSGEKAYIGKSGSGTFYGRVLKRTQKSSTDALFVRRDSSYPSESRVGIYVSPSDPAHAVTAREPKDGYGDGETTCFSGMVSGYECGTISDGSFTNTELGLRDVVLTNGDACATYGDSGAPFFDGDSTAQGILSGIVVDSGILSERCLHSVYTKLSRDEAATGAKIILD
ncbi:MAG: S1 family peptidase [Egibacteraceae bacterium]